MGAPRHHRACENLPSQTRRRTLLPCPLTYASPPRLFHTLASGMEVFLLELACKSVQVTLYHSILHWGFLPMERTSLCSQFLLPVGFSFQRSQVAKEWRLQSCPPTALQNLGSGWWGGGDKRGLSGWEERWAGPRLKGLIAQKLGPNKGLNAAGILYLDILSCIPHHSSNPKPQPSEMLLSLIYQPRKALIGPSWSLCLSLP